MTLRTAVRTLLLCLALHLPGATAAAGLAERHEALLAGQLAKLQTSRAGTTELYLLAAGMSNKQDVFRHDVESMRDLFDRHWNTAGRSVALVADDATKNAYAYPTRANLARAGEALAKKIDPQKDVLLLFLTSHGTSKGLEATLPGDQRFTFSAVDVRQLLEATGARHRVVILSACHSGALMGELSDENTLVLAAAHGSRSSFGCSFTHLHTWFTQAMYEALAATPRFEQAFAAATRRIEQRELGGEAFEHSMPQIHAGRAIRAKLAEVERRATRATGWEPPVHSTEEGRVRQMLGDYLATVGAKGREAQVRWLQLRRVGASRDGSYPVFGWAQHFYRAGGEFKATYDPKARVLSGNTPALGRFSLSLEGQRFTGTSRAGGDEAPPVELAFDRVQRREVFEATAQHPPAKMRAKPGSSIRLLYLGAEDCGPCRKWERDHLQEGRLTGMPEYQHIEFITARRARLKSRLRKDDLPENLAHLYERFEANKSYQPLFTQLPAFVLMVDDEVRVWRTDPFLDSPVYPVLRAAVREKTGAAR